MLQPDEDISIRQEKYGKTAMKDIDFLRFFKDTITLEESDPAVNELLCKRSTFREVVARDCEFCRTHNMIDYSMLVGKIETEDDLGFSTLDELKEKIEDDPSLAHGVYFTQATEDQPQEAYVLAIIDPLTAFM